METFADFPIKDQWVVSVKPRQFAFPRECVAVCWERNCKGKWMSSFGARDTLRMRLLEQHGITGLLPFAGLSAEKNNIH